MIPVIRAFTWLRVRLLLNAFKKSKGRDTVERLSRAAQALTPIILGLLLAPTAVIIGLLGVLGGFMLGSGEAPGVLIAIRIVLLVVTIMVLIAPMVRSFQGLSPNIARLVLLPIPRPLLHMTEVIGGVTDPWLAIVLPGILLLPAGLLLAGAPLSAVLALAAGLAFIGAVLALSALVSVLLQLAFRDRRRGEVVTLLAILALSSIGIAGVFINENIERRREAARETAPVAATEAGESAPAAATEPSTETRAEQSASGTQEDVANPPAGRADDVEKNSRSRPSLTLPRWLGFLPSELYGSSLSLAVRGRRAASLAPLGGLLLIGAAVYGLSLKGYGRLLETPAGGSRRRGSGELRLREARLPGLSPVVSALAIAQVKTALRTVRGKAAVFITPVILLMVGVMLSVTDWEDLSKVGTTGMTIGAGFAVLAICLMAIEPVQANQFATDKAGLTLQFLSPVSDRDIVLGKAAGSALMAGLPALIVMVPAAVFLPGRVIPFLPALVMAGVAGFLLFAPLAAILSAVFPKPSDLSKMGKVGNPHPMAAFLSTLAAVFVLLPPAGFTAIGVLVIESHLLAFVLVTLWAGLAAAAFRPLMQGAAGALAERRENLAMIAQER
jgi:hypothetical protein